EDPRNFKYVHHLADVYSQLAGLHSDKSQGEESLALYGQSRILFEQLVCVLPGEIWPQWGLALCLNNIGVEYNRLEQPRKAVRCSEAARAIRERIVTLRPNDSGARISLAASLRDLGVTHNGLGDRDEALRLFQQVLPLREQVAKDNPNVTQYQG